MSSLRNAVQRRNHKERAQPTERAKWGLLEKRKDYKLRAADHKSKTKKIAALKSKASERNEDEFYFGMMSNSTKNGVKIAKKGQENGGGQALDVDVVRLMKTQDQGYLRTALQRCRREIARVEERVVVGRVGVDVEGVGRGKVVFGEDGEEFAVRGSGKEVDGDVDVDFDMDFSDEESGEEGEDVEEENLTPEEKLARSRKQHALDVKRRKLEALREQEEKLSAALEALEHQRAKMNHTIGGTNKAGVKFKTRERKR
ncbi:related to cgi-94 protein [Ramularia collo-cygni]|uniref:U3 small nucleolar RNA-associated protein 11 n=1 Tax=Ramularia collo-cygni TaxID=112498 RepID=A0A2D3UM98_9PEZI|nr:related to cgi-94 protein [Ramularia collo-cygni]CZT15011.1 related to cgi-94 protein [Ramularia collo-cygni]